MLRFCYSMNVCSPKIHLEILSHNLMVVGSRTFERWLGHLSRVLVNKIGTLTKETPEKCIPSPLAMWTCRKKTAFYESGSESLPDTESCQNPVGGLPSLQSCEEYTSVYKPSGLWYCYSRLNAETNPDMFLARWLFSICPPPSPIHSLSRSILAGFSYQEDYWQETKGYLSLVPLSCLLCQSQLCHCPSSVSPTSAPTELHAVTI